MQRRGIQRQDHLRRSIRTLWSVAFVLPGPRRWSWITMSIMRLGVAVYALPVINARQASEVETRFFSTAYPRAIQTPRCLYAHFTTLTREPCVCPSYRPFSLRSTNSAWMHPPPALRSVETRWKSSIYVKSSYASWKVVILHIMHLIDRSLWLMYDLRKLQIIRFLYLKLIFRRSMIRDKIQKRILFIILCAAYFNVYTYVFLYYMIYKII